MKSFGTVCRDLRNAAGLSQKEVAEAGGLEQSRVSEIERDKYLPGLDLAVRLAHGLGMTLTDIVSRWEGTTADAGAVPRRVARQPEMPLDVPQEDILRRVRGLWELMTSDRRDIYLKQGKTLVAEQWKAEARGEANGVVLRSVPAERAGRLEAGALVVGRPPTTTPIPTFGSDAVVCEILDDSSEEDLGAGKFQFCSRLDTVEFPRPSVPLPRSIGFLSCDRRCDFPPPSVFPLNVGPRSGRQDFPRPSDRHGHARAESHPVWRSEAAGAARGHSWRARGGVGRPLEIEPRKGD